MLQASVSSANSSRLSFVSEPTNIAFSSVSSITSLFLIKFSINLILSKIFIDIISFKERLLFSSVSNLLLYKLSIPKEKSIIFPSVIATDIIASSFNFNRAVKSSAERLQ